MNLQPTKEKIYTIVKGTGDILWKVSLRLTKWLSDLENGLKSFCKKEIAGKQLSHSIRKMLSMLFNIHPDTLAVKDGHKMLKSKVKVI